MYILLSLPLECKFHRGMDAQGLLPALFQVPGKEGLQDPLWNEGMNLARWVWGISNDP